MKKASPAFLLILGIIVLINASCSRGVKEFFTIGASSRELLIGINSKSISQVKIEIPEGAVNEDVDLIIRSVEAPPLNTDIIYTTGPCLDFMISKDNLYFNKPVSISFMLSRELSGIPLIGYYNEKEMVWEYLSPSEYTSNSITFTTNHFSIFSLLIFDMGGISEIIEGIRDETAFYGAIRDYKKDKRIDPDNSEFLTVFEAKADQSYQNLLAMETRYDDCKDHFTCKLIYKDFVDFILAQFITWGVQKTLLDAVLAGSSGAATVTTTFAIGALIADAMIIDCLACFLPNSIVSFDFWYNLLNYNLANQLVREINLNSAEIVKLEYKTWRGDLLSETEFIRHKLSVNDFSERYQLDFTEPFYTYYIDDNLGTVLEDGMDGRISYYINILDIDGEKYLEKYNGRDGEIIYCVDPLGYFVIKNQPGGDGMSDRVYPYSSARYDSNRNGWQMGAGQKY